MTLRNEYFEWLMALIKADEGPEELSFKKLLMHLHNRPFQYSIAKDRNRALDGIALRRRFAMTRGCVDNFIEGDCSIFEMMVALAIRCEEDIMDDPTVGDRTAQWFWEMVNNLGLGSMVDDRYDCDYVDRVLERFIMRKYDRDGTGGLFRVRHCWEDLRKVEIWYQLCWYLDSIT